MLKLKRFLKNYPEPGAFHSLLNPHRFIDDETFLRKGNALVVVIAIDAIDPECPHGRDARKLDTPDRSSVARLR